MKKVPTSLSLLALAATLGLAACADGLTPLTPAGAASFDESAAAPATWLVAFDAGSVTDLDARVQALGGAVEWSHAGAGIAAVTGLSPEGAQQLGATPGIGGVAADGLVEIAPASDLSAVETVDSATAASLDAALSESNPTTAFFYPRHWNLRAIGAEKAWAAGVLGSSDVTVAILDTGIDHNYPDLRGLVDLSRSVSFIPADDNFVRANFPSRHVSTDLHYHGTHVASLVSSKAGAVAGVTSRTTLIAVKVLGASGSGPTSGVLRGVLYAADAGADVINMSLGSGFFKEGNEAFLEYANSVFEYAFAQGALVVVSAGNDSRDLDHNGNFNALYCNQPGVVCVSATGPTAQASVNGPFTNVDAFAPYSNFGKSAISVAAPGGSAARVWGACSTTSLNSPVCRTGTFTIGVNGTSQAAPHVSGLAALLVAKLGKDKPAQVRSAIRQNADDLGATGSDPYYGKGRINVARALGL